MGRVLKILGILFGAVLALVLIAVGMVYVVSGRQINRTHELPATTVVVATSPEAVARGEHLVGAVGSCLDCHGEDLGGKVVMDAGPLGVMVASNLTRGAGGIGSSYSDAAWEHAIRHGLQPNGKSLLLMPANLTPAGAIGSWTAADFFALMREGRRPDGQVISEFMPWRFMARMTDDELRALWLYLQTVPAKETVAPAG